MSDNVIYLSRSQRRQDEDNENQIRARNVMKLRRIEDDPGPGKTGPKFRRIQDRMIAGKEIDRLCRRAKEEGIEIGDIKVEFERIDRYRIGENLDTGSLPDRAKAEKKLLQRVHNYLRIAEIVAEKLAEDPDDLKISVLQNTSIWSRPPNGSDGTQPDERAEALALGLREMAQRVVRDAGLIEFFEQARQIPGGLDISTGTFKKSTITCLFTQACQDWFEHWEEMPPLPNVPLIRFLHARIPARVIVDLEEYSEIVDSGIEISDDFEGEEIDATFLLFREIRLAIGPTIGPKDIGAMFESRAHVEISIPGDTRCEVRPSFTLEFADVGEAMLVRKNEKWHRVKCLTELHRFDQEEMALAAAGRGVESHWLWDFTPLEEKKQCFEHYYVSWTPVRDDYVTLWLDRPERFGPSDDLTPYIEAGFAPPETWYIRSSLAHPVEVALLSGALQTALVESADQFGEALQKREEEWRTGATEVMDNQIARWRDDLSDPSPSGPDDEK